MNRKAGFTLIELLVTMTIMAILLSLAVITLRANQIAARDERRKTDVATIAQQLESYYNSGTDAAVVGAKAGQYPPTQLVDTESEVKATLRDLDPKTLRAPDVADASPMSFTVAPDAAQPNPAINTYVYQPLTSADAICQTTAQDCRKFNLFYKQESDNTVQKVVSKNQ